MTIRSLIASTALCIAALGLVLPSAQAEDRGERGGRGGRPAAARPAPAPAGPRFAPPQGAAPRLVAPRIAAPARAAPQAYVPGPAYRQAAPQRYSPGPVYRQAAPMAARPQYAARPAARAGGAYPRFLARAHRRFWHGRWIWFGPVIAPYDPCWQRLWTDWGWGWFYTCGYYPDPNDPDGY